MDVLLSVIKLLGGLALLIYGMKMLSSQLKKLSGGKLEKILSSVTDNPFKGLFVGFLITVGGFKKFIKESRFSSIDKR